MTDRARGPFFFLRPAASAVALVAALAATAHAQGFDPSKTPVTKVPAARWGQLEPTAILGDLSWWNFGSTPWKDHTFFHGLDTENGYLFVATGRGLSVYDGRATPEAPTKTAYVFAQDIRGIDWNQNDTKFYLFSVDAPAGEDGVLAMSAINTMGMWIWDTRSKSAPRLAYQDGGHDGNQVYAATFGGRDYGFLAAGGDKVLVYDMTAAQGLSAFCLEYSEVQVKCRSDRNVYVGKLGTAGGVNYVAGDGDFLAASMGSAVEIWNVSSPSTPIKITTVTPPGVSRGVALWRQGAKTYLAVVEYFKTRIYDVSCVSGGACGTPPPVVHTFDSTPYGMYYATFSRSNGKPFLYLGGEDQFSGGPQREYLLDVTDPSNPVDVTPATVGGNGYWGWYYYGNPTGFNWVMPRMGKFNGAHFYRAAFSLLDVHEYTGDAPPIANFTWSPTEIYPGTQVQFQSTSTGSVSNLEWVFSDGTPASSTANAPAVSFGTVGNKTVTLVASNGAEQSQKVQSVPVLDPAPAVSGLAISPANPKVCQPVTLTAQGVTGQAPLTYSWSLTGPQGAVPVGSATGSLVWNTAIPLAAAGSYTAQVTVMNGAGNAPASLPFTLTAPAALPAAGQFTPSNDPFTAGTVQFHVNVAGATEWNWDFGDGNGYRGWTNDPITGPNPVHTYAAIGQKQVKVQVRNCTVTGGIESAALSVNITQTTPLVASWDAYCPFNFCSFGTNEAITFNDASTGAETWDYDWDGNGTFEDAGNTAPKTSHSYAANGNYNPKLRVNRGAESKTAALPRTLNVANLSNPPAITVSGPTSGKVGAALSFSAFASNCVAASSGWTWSVNGGTIAGASNGSSISVSWGSAGTKSVQARNSSCAGAVGTRSVALTTEGGGGGGGGNTSLTASYSYSPTVVGVGAPVSFDGSGSSGSPTGYIWDFGDETAFGSGANVSHTFSTAGSYIVKLTVTKPGSCPPAPFCESSTQKTIVVGDGSTPLVPSFTSPSCEANLNFVVCKADVGDTVTLTDTSTGDVTSRAWDFGDDGEGASGATVSHVWDEPGTFQVTLTVGDGKKTATKTQAFVIEGEPVVVANFITVPWIAQSDGALDQTSDLFLFNPDAKPMTVELSFKKRGTPDPTAQPFSITLAAKETKYFGNLLGESFGISNLSGSLRLQRTSANAADPVVLSYNRTFQEDGSQFGQSVPGLTDNQIRALVGKASTPFSQNLVGLHASGERLSYFGVTNPTDATADFRVKVVDADGTVLGEGPVLTLAPYGQRQYQPVDIEGLGGGGESDFRILVEVLSGGPVYPYGANLFLGPNDPSFVPVGNTRLQRQYLVGMLTKPGLNDSNWISDLVATNTTASPMSLDLSFVPLGINPVPTNTITVPLAPGATTRLADVLRTEWGLTDDAGVLIAESAGAGGVYPIVQGETYDDQGYLAKYGQTVAPRGAEAAAVAGEVQTLIGLRADDEFRTVLWLFNPHSQQGASTTVVYRALNGTELGRLDFGVPAGGIRQIAPSQHPLGETFSGSFTVEIEVKTGALLSAAQVVNNVNNDPAYVAGETR